MATTEHEVNILDYFFLLYRARWYIIWNFVIVCALAVAISLVLPKYYTSKTSMLPPTEGSEGFGFSQAMSMLPVNISLGSTGTPADIYMGVLKSQTVANSIISQYNLMEVYGARDIETAQTTLKGLTDIRMDPEGLIVVEVEDRDPMRAANIVNTYIALLDSVNQAINHISANERASFMADQIAQNSIVLKSAEDALLAFQQRSNAISPLQQQRTAVSATSQLEMDIMARETLLNEYLASSLSENHPLVQNLLRSIQTRREQLDNLRFGGETQERESLFLPLEETPGMTLEYEKLLRRVEVLTQVDQLLQQQYEQATIESRNITSTVSVLDKGRPAVRKSRPKRKVIVLASAAASLFFSIISIVVIEYINRLTELNPDNREKVRRLARLLHIES